MLDDLPMVIFHSFINNQKLIWCWGDAPKVPAFLALESWEIQPSQSGNKWQLAIPKSGNAWRCQGKRNHNQLRPRFGPLTAGEVAKPPAMRTRRSPGERRIGFCDPENNGFRLMVHFPQCNKVTRDPMYIYICIFIYIYLYRLSIVKFHKMVSLVYSPQSSFCWWISPWQVIGMKDDSVPPGTPPHIWRWRSNMPPNQAADRPATKAVVLWCRGWENWSGPNASC